MTDESDKRAGKPNRQTMRKAVAKKSWKKMRKRIAQ
jgi:hypothetical protein